EVQAFRGLRARSIHKHTSQGWNSGFDRDSLPAIGSFMRGFMKNVFILIALSGVALVSAAWPTLQAQKSASPPQRQIAVTFDDLPLNGRDVGIASLQQMTEKLTAGIRSR